MISNDEIQATFILFLKSQAALTSILVNSKNGTSEIRERSWQGTEFTYPNIRVWIGRNEADKHSYCEKSDADLCVYVYSELPSSDECDHIAGLVANSLDKRQFTMGGLRFIRNKAVSISAAERKNGTWQSQVKFNSLISR